MKWVELFYMINMNIMIRGGNFFFFFFKNEAPLDNHTQPL